ncbi:hypothetical protein ABB37_04934 [Leptomonas pyrrhocoris]|uniref:Uncharacterized protein n=1 Tax=Leptomonas pyrrhocoris TaxID=157538 RepID=A0A0M9G0P8_LEPPY|nr:hypothetical protein ABB37_04934 [Leptomonas pyrrhocoris]XP_015658293.1 hypothetical protein ABB37_04934 [Leptomonas pyrrhocoris]KPA79853.1 hypothetical protein ABB37_04934 [Leptomonas pyrrhocoris]KPA79854.1 hypothetical protein ABB37_04934 [Leptomonas pyrrhocoris]|eukprot:XP_015658292.1 hypothetical protein ABB37_04934 [Leptomonas pyrrhocoris]
MRRPPPDPAAETRVRFFLVGALIGLLTLLLSCYFTLRNVAANDHLRELNAAIRAVEGAQVSTYLALMNATRIPRVFEPGQHPLYVVTCIPEDETAEAQEIVRQVAYTFRTVPMDADYVHHPLTAAYRHHRYKAAKILREVWQQFQPDEDSLMSEVYGSMLSLAELREVDLSVLVHCETYDTFRCRAAVDAARLRNGPSSQLERTYQLRHGTSQPSPPRIPFRDPDIPRKVVAPASTVRAGFWKDPFRPPLAGLLPPRDTLVMNPGYFSDPASQVLYMVFGHIEGSMLLTGFVIFSLSLTCFSLAAWALGVACWMVSRA